MSKDVLFDIIFECSLLLYKNTNSFNKLMLCPMALLNLLVLVVFCFVLRQNLLCSPGWSEPTV